MVAQGSRCGRSPFRSGVPRRLRDRPVAPGSADSLRSLEPPHRRLRRARVCAVARHGGASCAAAGLPLGSLETFTPLSEFDIVGFTLQYELTYTNLLAMLDLGGIPLRAAQRGCDDPLVIAGGPCAFNPEPLADFLDAVLLGDGENVIHEICDTYLAWDRRDRNDLLAALAGIRGVYVPAFFEPRYAADGRLTEIRPLRPGYDARREADRPRPEQRTAARDIRRTDDADRARPAEPRGHARLREGLPLLPGRLHLPPTARARSAPRPGAGRACHRADRPRRSVAPQL